MSEFPSIKKLGLLMCYGSEASDSQQVIFASDLETLLQASVRDPIALGYVEGQEIFVLATKPTIEPLGASDVIELLTDFYQPVTKFSEPMIKKLIQRLSTAGLNGSEAVKVVIPNAKPKPESSDE